MLELRNPSSDSFFLMKMLALSERYGFGRVEYDPDGEPAATVDGEDPGDEVVEEEAAEEPEEAEAEEGEPAVAEWPDGLYPPTEVVRVGELPLFEGMKQIDSAGEDMWEGKVFAAWPISNSVLVNKGLGWWSPIEVFEDGRALTRMPSRKEFRAGCSGCYLHLGKQVVFTPFSDTDAEFDVRLTSDLPMTTIDEQQVYWVYPRGSLEFRFPAWQDDMLQVTVTTQPLGPNEQTADLTVLGKTVAVARGKGRRHAILRIDDPPKRPWTATVASPVEGTYHVITAFTVSNGEWTLPVFPLPQPPSQNAKRGDGDGAGDEG